MRQKKSRSGVGRTGSGESNAPHVVPFDPERLTMLNSSYPGDRDRAAGNLTAAHRAMLERGSAIAPKVIAERGYYSARSRADVPECFPSYQRRPGLVIPGLTVEGERRYRLRPERPRKDKRGKPQ